MPKLKTSAEVADEITAPPPSPAASADTLALLESEAAKVQRDFSSKLQALEEQRRARSLENTECAAAVYEIARLVWIRKCYKAEASLADPHEDHETARALMEAHFVERDTYEFAQTRTGLPYRCEMPIPRTMEHFGQRSGEKLWTLAMDIQTRGLRAAVAKEQIPLITAKIAALVKTVRASVAANRWDIADMIRNGCSLVLPVQRPVVIEAEVLAELEAAQ